ncbi:MAG: helix-turn-helix transcriptional regulator [Halanaerobiaceae bacterium]|nr:helix-turn-helix transcriptional regulator [Halanaerobiaceae bacterium]
MLSERLKQLRKEQNITQQELAEKLGFNRATISGYETKGVEPGYDILIQLSRIFNCSIDYLLGRTNERSTVDDIKGKLASDPEIADFWDNLLKREDLQELYRETKNLSPKAIRQIIRIIKAMDFDEMEN